MFKYEKDAIFTVDEVTNKIREAIYASGELQNISVKGELLGFKKHSSGHAYFTIIGAEARISCVLFRSNASSVILWPKDGDEVLVRGKVDVYGARGSYQIYASTLLPLGEGAKARAKEIIFRQLTAEGIFDIRHKRELPLFPGKVALITSPTSAAVQDVIKIASIRYPAAELLVIPSLMQGAAASSEIRDAFSKCASLQDISLVMLVRGGGSRDDLDTFDSEEVVRAVRSCPVPVITGLGHQIDKTLSDLAADAYAPTPSGAAERVFPDSKELTAYLKSSMRSMHAHINKRAEKICSELTDSKRRLLFSITRGVCIPASEFLNNAQGSLISNVTYKMSEAEAKLTSAAGTLNNLSPLSVMSRGFTICRDSEGNMIKDASSLSEHQRVGIYFRDGHAETEVKSICKES
ncbi:MAG TPA: exodeoxyribonuclease VII large subunit [Synergistaceae bacterium]|nr:exodeoxyribonuclease VII large subunit [Synergistaceae bacterium]